MLHALSSDSFRSSRKIWWVHGARNGREDPFVQEARELLDTISGSRSAIAYSKPDPTDRPGEDFNIQGRLDLTNLQRIGFPVEAEFYACGPTGFLKDINRHLMSLGVPQDAIHQEVFGPADSIEPGIAKAATTIPHAPVGSLADGPTVSFTRSGLNVPWDKRFKSLLEFAEACHVPVRWSCRTGVCHICGLLDGTLRYAPEPLDRPAVGNALICCSTPGSAVELDL